MDPILVSFEQEWVKRLGEHDTPVWVNNNTQVSFNKPYAMFLKKEVGKGDVYRLSIWRKFTDIQNEELFLDMIRFFKEKEQDAIFEFEGNLVATGENSEKVVRLFHTLLSHASNKIHNAISCFSFTGLPFVQYKYNVKLYPKNGLEIVSAFKGTDGKNNKKHEKNILSSEDAFEFISEYEEEIEIIRKNANLLHNFVQSIDPDGKVSFKGRHNVSFFKKSYTYRIIKQSDDPDFMVEVKHGHDSLHVFSGRPLVDTFEEIKKDIKKLYNKDRLHAIMESRI